VTELTNIVTQGEFRIDKLAYAICPPESFDMQLFNNDESARFSTLIAPRRKCEFYYTRVLWNKVGNGETINYNSLGMPVVKGTNISISHSGTEIIIGQHIARPIGVDIEMYHEKVLRISDKFLSSTEIERFGNTDLCTLTAIWSAKESFFKLFCDEHLKFAEQMEIMQLEPNPSAKIKHLTMPKSHDFSIKTFEKFVITYCILRD